MVNAGILVPVKTLQVLLAYIDHLGKASSSTLSILDYSQRHRIVLHLGLVQIMLREFTFKKCSGRPSKTWKRDAKLRGMTERFLALLKKSCDSYRE